MGPTQRRALENARGRRVARCARVHGRRALDADCVSARGGILHILRQLPEAVTLALAVQLAALPGWSLRALDAQGA